MNVGLPRLLHFLVEEGISEGSSLIVQGRLRVDQYVNNRGVRITSLGVVAQRIRLDSRVELNVQAGGREGRNNSVIAAEIVRSLRNSNLLETPGEMELNAAERLILSNIEESDLVIHNGADARDLFGCVRTLVD